MILILLKTKLKRIRLKRKPMLKNQF